MKNKNFIFSDHCLKRCWERHINPNEIRKVLISMEIDISGKSQLCFHPEFLSSFGILCKSNCCIVLIINRRVVKTCYLRRIQECRKNQKLIHLNY